MTLLLKLVGTTGIVFLFWWSCERLVFDPAVQNVIIGEAMTLTEQVAQPHQAREMIRTIRGCETWDPYLRGLALVERAQLERQLGRNVAALQDYRRALDQRISPEVEVELALFEFELGDQRAAQERLKRISRFFPQYRGRVPPGPLRRIMDE